MSKMSVALAETLNAETIVAMEDAAGIKQTKLNPETVVFTDHAWKRAKERFNYQNNEKDKALEYFRNCLKTAECFGKVMCDETKSKDHLLYGVTNGNNPFCIIISSDYRFIITVLKVGITSYPSLIKDKIKLIYRTELKKLQRKAKSMENKLPLLEAKVNADIYSAKYNILKTTSKKKKEAFETQIKDAETGFKAFSENLDEIEKNIRQMAHQIVGLIHIQ